MKVGQIMNVVLDNANAKKREHYINILTMVKNPIAIPEHTNLVDAIREELKLAAEQLDIIEAVQDFKHVHAEDGIF